MIYAISGSLKIKDRGIAVIETSGISFKLMVSVQTMRLLPDTGCQSSLFTHLHFRDDGAELYGFFSVEELHFFQLLISVSGVGPKSALAILGIADLKSLSAAIKESRPDLLTRVSGIGRKTAERIIVELKNKVDIYDSTDIIREMDLNLDIIEMLISLGYRKDRVVQALKKVPSETGGTEDRLRAALKILSGK